MVVTKLLILGLFLVSSLIDAESIPIDNGVAGEPEIECGPTAITVNFNTRNPFEGHVYVKGKFAEQGCRNDDGGRNVAGISLPFDTCGVQRTRSLNPRGVFVNTVVIISFHPQFETKVDRAYRLQCFYMEADKTVSSDMEVSILTTAFQTQVVPMPTCRYDILEGGTTGQPIRFAIIGQQVYHKWTCDTETTDIFCMVVHSCYVDDGAGDKVDLLDENGCALDRYLLRNLEYLTDLMAGQEAHVFKYADRAQLFFQCQISITIKEPNTQCSRPQCQEPTKGRKRSVRNDTVAFVHLQSAGVLDVATSLESLDLHDDLLLPRRHPILPNQVHQPQRPYCLSYSGMGLLLAASTVLFIIVVALAVAVFVRPIKH